jgi:sugar O-acyltransferase (sialic acid O-acetyltransferase NeuD family)
MKNIAIVGAGGFGREIFCVWKEKLIFDDLDFNFLGFFDDGKKGESNDYGNVIGTVDDLNKMIEDIDVAIAIGNSKLVKDVRERIHNNKIHFPNIIHPTAKFLDKESVFLSEGNVFSIDTIISNNVILGKFNSFNTRATLGHDVAVGDYNIFSPNVQISGEVKIGNSNLFGFNSGVMQQLKIGNNNTLGVGALLLRSITDNGSYIGIPAKKFNM